MVYLTLSFLNCTMIVGIIDYTMEDRSVSKHQNVTYCTYQSRMLPICTVKQSLFLRMHSRLIFSKSEEHSHMHLFMPWILPTRCLTVNLAPTGPPHRFKGGPVGAGLTVGFLVAPIHMPTGMFFLPRHFKILCIKNSTNSLFNRVSM
jgi:hypothetical protein